MQTLVRTLNLQVCVFAFETFFTCFLPAYLSNNDECINKSSLWRYETKQHWKITISAQMLGSTISRNHNLLFNLSSFSRSTNWFSFQKLGVVIVCSSRHLGSPKQVLVWSVRAVSCLVFVGGSRQSAVGGVMRCYARGESGAPRPTTPVVSTECCSI